MGPTQVTHRRFPGSTFEEYCDSFRYNDEQLFHLLFERNKSRIKSKTIGIAAANLKRIFETTFTLSAQTGFHEMSLRTLSRETGISMGGLYSCLTKKEDIALMVLDIVELVTNENNHKIEQAPNDLTRLEMAIKYHLYATTLLQPWFFFLYFETRCLSPENQMRSKAIEMNTIALIETTIQQRIDKGIFPASRPYFIAHTTLIVLQDWYLKPWKNKHKQIDLEHYSDNVFLMVKKLLQLDDGNTPQSNTSKIKT